MVFGISAISKLGRVWSVQLNTDDLQLKGCNANSLILNA